MDARKNITIPKMMLLNMVNFGIVAFWSFDGAAMPLFLTSNFGLSNTAITLILGIGKFMIVLSLFFGLYSDLTQLNWGKRRPLMLLGGLIAAPLIALIPHMQEVWSLVAVITVVYFGMQFTAVPYYALVPEVVPNEKLGTANAFFSVSAASAQSPLT
jgi:Na+/melibiose symporter-like transporter